MKTLLIIALFALTFAADPEQCLKDMCPKEYSACEKEVFGCAVAATRCKNQCGGSDATCMYDCAIASKNAKLIALATCGKEQCSEITTLFCDIVACTESFKLDCTQSLGLKSFQCAQTFFDRHPECQCVADL